MATLAQLRQRVRNRADMPDADGLVSDDELDTYIQDSYAELVDLLMQKHEDMFTVITNVSASSSPITSMDLSHAASPAGDPGWVKIRRVEVRRDGAWVPLERIPIDEWSKYNNVVSTRPLAFTALADEIHILPEPAGVNDYRVFYLPNPGTFTETAPTIVLRWEEYVVIDAAIKCLRKEEQDVSELMQEKAAMQSRIATSATDRDGPARITEVRKYPGSTVSIYWDWLQ